MQKRLLEASPEWSLATLPGRHTELCVACALLSLEEGLVVHSVVRLRHRRHGAAGLQAQRASRCWLLQCCCSVRDSPVSYNACTGSAPPAWAVLSGCLLS